MLDSCAIIAGSKPFVEALRPQVQARYGGLSRVACDPDAFVEACRDASGLAVVEHGGPGWIEAVKAVCERRGPGALAIVVAVPAARASDLEAFRSAGASEAVRCDARLDPVFWAIDRLLSRQHPAAPDDPPKLGRNGAVPVAPSLVAPAPIAPVSPAGVGGESSAELPRAASIPPLSELPPPAEIEAVLAKAAAGSLEVDEPLREPTRRFAAQLTEIEKMALAAGPLPFDGTPLRASAALRWRVMMASLRAGEAGALPDPRAGQELPVAIDAMLAALKALADVSPPEVQQAIAPARNALVADAVRLTGLLAEAQGEAAPAAAPAPAWPSASTAPSARVLSNEKSEPVEGSKSRKALVIALVLVVAGAAAFHGYSWAHRSKPRPMPRMEGAPAGMILYSSPRKATKILVLEPGKTLDKLEVERFQKDQELRGNAVTQVSPTTLVVKPRSAVEAK